MSELTPITRTETFLAQGSGASIEPITRMEKILAGEDIDPVNRLEHFAKEAASGGGGSATLIEKNITANGTYKASDDDADGYSQVNVAVPASAVVSGKKTITANGDNIDVTNYASVKVNVDSGAAVGTATVDNQSDVTVGIQCLKVTLGNLVGYSGQVDLYVDPTTIVVPVSGSTYIKLTDIDGYTELAFSVTNGGNTVQRAVYTLASHNYIVEVQDGDAITISAAGGGG